MGFKEIGRKIQIARESGDDPGRPGTRPGITQAALSNYELGKRRLYLTRFERDPSVLGKGLDFFVQGKERDWFDRTLPDESGCRRH